MSQELMEFSELIEEHFELTEIEFIAPDDGLLEEIVAFFL
jgi:hypothetical protein